MSKGFEFERHSFSRMPNLQFQEFHRKYAMVPTDKAANNVIVVCRLHYINTLKQETDSDECLLLMLT